MDRINATIDAANKIPVDGASIRNLNIAGFLFQNGFFQVKDPGNHGRSAVRDQKQQLAYAKAMNQLVSSAGKKNFTVTVSSFDPQTLYAEFKGYTLLFFHPASEHRPERKELLVITRLPDGTLSVMNPSPEGKRTPKEIILHSGQQESVGALSVSAAGLGIRNENGQIILRVNGRDFRVDESSLDDVKLVALDDNSQIMLAADGTGRAKEFEGKDDKIPLFKLQDEGGTQVFFRNRIVKRQTHMTETVNYSKLVQIGLLEKQPDQKDPLEGKVPVVTPDAVP